MLDFDSLELYPFKLSLLQLHFDFCDLIGLLFSVLVALVIVGLQLFVVFLYLTQLLLYTVVVIHFLFIYSDFLLLFGESFSESLQLLL